MFLCRVCQTVSKPGEKRNIWPVTRQRGGTAHEEIASEIPVCYECYALLKSDVPLNVLIGCHGKVTHVPPPKAVPHSPSGEVVDAEEPLVSHSKQGGERKTSVSKKKLVRLCDICGESAEGGSVTGDAVLCTNHMQSLLGDSGKTNGTKSRKTR